MKPGDTPAMLATVAGVMLSGLVAVAAAAPATSAKVTLNTVTGAPTTYAGAADRVYDVARDFSASCGKSGTPIAAGWSDAGILVHAIRDRLKPANGHFAISPRVPAETATIRPHAICAKGPVKATVKSKARGSGPVSCGRKLAIGIALTATSPYNNERSAESKPVGKNGWVTDAPNSDTRAICVAASAFDKVTTIRRTAKFSVGKPSAKVTAQCTGQRRPIGWGYFSPLMLSNIWRSTASSAALSVPFVSGSLPSGKRGWSLVFRTPNGRVAAETVQVGIYLTCAVPR